MSQEREKQEVAWLLLFQCSLCQREFGEGYRACPYDGESLQSRQLDAPPLPSQYRCLTVLGKGGMGVIFKARQLLLDKIVAIKMLNPEHTTNQAVQRFQREGRAAALLNHRNIAAVQDFGVLEDNQLYMVMDYIEGPSLETLLRQRTTLPVSEAIDLFIGVCDGLACAHQNGILHRDLKPSNIMLEQQENGTLVPKLVDFGIAKLLEADAAPNLTRTGEIVGSPTYMSPEQAQVKELDERSDLYSLGCVMFEGLTGRPPFVANSSVDVLFKHMYSKPISLHDAALGKLELPQDLEYIVGKLLSKSPSERFSSAQELKSHLLQLQNKLYALAPEDTNVVGVKPPARRKITPYLVATTAAILTILVCGLLVARYFFQNSSLEKVGSSPDSLPDNKTLSESEKSEAKAVDEKISDAAAHGIERQQPILTFEKGAQIPWDDIAADGALMHLHLIDTKITDTDLQRLAGHHKLEELDLSGCTKLTDEGLKYLCDLNGLKKLNLSSDPKITGTGFSSFVASPVKELDLDRTNFNDDGCAAVSQMSSVGTLNIGQTNITDAGLRDLSHLPGLNTLYIANTGVTDFNGFDRNSKLAHLAANQTLLTDQGIRLIGKLTGLQSLYLVRVKVSPKALASLGDLPNLSDLDLSFDRIDAPSMVALSKCPLRALNLSNCLLNQSTLEALTRCKSVDTLDLSHTSFSSLDFVSQLPNLTKLSLASCDFNPNALVGLANNKSVKHLYLVNSKVRLLDLDPIAKMQKLEELDLRGCAEMSVQDVETLKQKLSKLPDGRSISVITTDAEHNRLNNRRRRHHR